MERERDLGSERTRGDSPGPRDGSAGLGTRMGGMGPPLHTTLTANPPSSLWVPNPQEESPCSHILFSLSPPTHLAGKGLRGEAGSSQGSRWNAGSLGTDPAVSLGKPGCGNPTHSPLPRMRHRMPETDPTSPRGASVRVGKPPCPSPSLARPRSSVGQL